MTIETSFDVGARVWIKELRSPGRVMAVFIDRDGAQFSVRWFKDNEPKTAYFLSDELSSQLPETTKPGFAVKPK